MTSVGTVSHPHVLYVGLQKAGSKFLRGYFDAHPEIVRTREAYRLQSTGLIDSYLDAVRQAISASHAVSAARERPPICIDMFESIGMAYSLLGSHRWSRDLMISPEPILRNERIDVAPQDCFDRIHGLLPSIRVLLTVRSQVEWIFSNYHHFVRLLTPGRLSFPDFLETVEGRVVLGVAHFDQLVGRIYAAFGRANVLVMPLESLERDPDQALLKLSAFLGVSHVPFAPEDDHFNRGVDYTYGAGREAITIAYGGTPEAGCDIPSKAALRRDFAGILGPMYAVSNVRLSRLVDFDVAALGYPL